MAIADGERGAEDDQAATDAEQSPAGDILEVPLGGGVEGFAARPCGLNENGEIGASLLLADEFFQPLRPQARFRGVLVAALGAHQFPFGVSVHRSCPRVYLFGSNCAIATTDGDLPFGTITRAFGS